MIVFSEATVKRAAPILKRMLADHLAAGPQPHVERPAPSRVVPGEVERGHLEEAS